MIYSYTETELKTLLKSLTIIVDTREQANNHVIDYFTKKKIPYITKKLDYGDYCCYIGANPELGIMRDMYFTDTVVIERKNSLTELSNNLSNDRERFVNELIRKGNTKLFLMIENTPNGYGDILTHNYRSQYNEKSFIGTLKSMESQYDIHINFLSDNELSGFFIWSTLYYGIRNYLLGRG
ncbi:MAG: hypothetical protein K0Q53_100 [Massilibacillus sp.]|jgi:ERCC4-type nuclease|nr:hypothetical protein [Massilibacillus sp.]